MVSKKVKLDLAKLENHPKALIQLFVIESNKQGWSKEERKEVLIECCDESYDYKTALTILIPYIENITDNSLTKERVEDLEDFEGYLEKKRKEYLKSIEWSKNWESQRPKTPVFSKRSDFLSPTDEENIPDWWSDD